MIAVRANTTNTFLTGSLSAGSYNGGKKAMAVIEDVFAVGEHEALYGDVHN